MRPEPGVELIMVSRPGLTPYSGMLPGILAGWYDPQEMHFDLHRLCAQARATFLCTEVTGIDTSSQRLHLKGYPSLSYDVASLNVGITPSLPPGAFGHPHVTVVKPIAQVLTKWERLLKAPRGRWLVVGGGGSGFEIAMILSLRRPDCEIELIEPGPSVLKAHNLRVQAMGMRLLSGRGIKVRAGIEVTQIQEQMALTSDNSQIEFDELIVTTGATAPGWFRASGLPVDEFGFVRVDRNLQVEGVKGLFAAGDCLHFSPQPLPKSGVFAVREGPVLIENLRRTVVGHGRLRVFRPQRFTLGLFTSGPKRALLSYGPLSWEADWLWKWKDRIDRRFMKRFSAEPRLFAGMDQNTCGGCGGKVENAVLVEGLSNLGRALGTDDVGWLGDQAVTIDGFRAFTKDLRLFGEVAVHHALNDLYASGARPVGATVCATLPLARSRLRANQLEHLMSGVYSGLGGVPLLNAHTSEGHEISLVISGIGQSRRRWLKQGLRPGSRLILTKRLGTGVLLQADMVGRLDYPQWTELREHLLEHHGRILDLDLPVLAATDISGFGLIGHLSEMLGSSPVTAELRYSQIAALPAFSQLASEGWSTFLGEKNRATYGSRWIAGVVSPLLFDPQTHGPILLVVAEEHSAAVLARLRTAGHRFAHEIGQVTASAQTRILLV